MTTDVFNLEMGKIKESLRGCDIVLVVGDTRVSDDESVDAKVER